MTKEIFYVDLTPCDDMQNYKKALFMPDFIKEDTPRFDCELPAVVQVATKYGWCIVAKWVNNGSTRIYASDERTLQEGVDILTGECDSGSCEYAHGDGTFHSYEISEKDSRVFFAWNALDAMAEEYIQESKPEPWDATKVYVEEVNYNEERNEYESVCIPTPLTVTVLVSNPEYFAEVFDNEVRRQMVIQDLRDEVMAEYIVGKTFPRHAMGNYKSDGHAIFRFNRLESDKWGESLVAYYEFESTVS